jgi:hypothetical protein
MHGSVCARAALPAGRAASIHERVRVVQAKGVDKTRRMFTGAEAISVVATDAIGHEVPIPVALDASGLRATAMLNPFVPGPLSLAICIANEPIPVSPLQLSVEPGKVSARHCSVIPVTPDVLATSSQVRPLQTGDPQPPCLSDTAPLVLAALCDHALLIVSILSPFLARTPSCAPFPPFACALSVYCGIWPTATDAFSNLTVP